MRSMNDKIQAIVPFALLALVFAAACPKPQTTPKTEKMPVAVRPTARRNTAATLFAEGVKALQASEWATARVKFEQALEKSSNLTSARYDLGLALQHLGELDAAAEAYQRVLKEDPDQIDAALNLAKVRRDQARYADGIAVLSKLRKKHRFDGRLLNDLAVLYRLDKKYKKAEKTLRTLLSRDADNLDAHKNLALVYYDQGRYRLAEFMMGTAKKRNDKDPGIYNNLGLIAIKRDDLRAALAQFKKAVELDPKFVQGHMNIGAVALRYRDYQAASDAFSKAVNLDAASWEAHYYYAQALEGGQDLEGAAREYAAVAKIRPDFPAAVYGLCRSLQNKHPDEAEGHCKHFLTMKGARPKEIENVKQRLESIKMMKEIAAEQASKPDEASESQGTSGEANPSEGSAAETSPPEAASPEETPAATSDAGATAPKDGKGAQGEDAAPAEPQEKEGRADGKKKKEGGSASAADRSESPQSSSTH